MSDHNESADKDDVLSAGAALVGGPLFADGAPGADGTPPLDADHSDPPPIDPATGQPVED